MPKCKGCGKEGLFLILSSDGYCESCLHGIIEEKETIKTQKHDNLHEREIVVANNIENSEKTIKPFYRQWWIYLVAFSVIYLVLRAFSGTQEMSLQNVESLFTVVGYIEEADNIVLLSLASKPLSIDTKTKSKIGDALLTRVC